MITKIGCIGYRGFSNFQELPLAIPNGKKGSGLTVLVGPNSGGKSTLVECFSKINQHEPSFTEGKRNKFANDKVKIEIHYDGKMGTLQTVESGGSETTWIPPYDKPLIYYIPSRRVFNPFFGKGMWDRLTFIQNPEISQFRGNPLNNFTMRLFDANRNSSMEFNELFWKILGKELHWTIDQDDSGQYYIKIQKADTIFHNSEGLGEGVVSLLFIVDALFQAQPNELIVIDEPELSLHPQLQKRLLDAILETTKKVQIVISTHSPMMISIDSIINNGQIARVHEIKGNSTISHIDETCRQYFKSSLNNIYNPHIFGNDARACFFAEDGVLITEGQEDVVLIPRLLEKLEISDHISLFGFGAGGASNIKNIAYILKCLGFSNICALFDGDKKEECAKFNQEFEQFGYKAWSLPADDIRDKEKHESGAKQGILDKNCQIKSEIDKNNLKKMFCEIIDFSRIKQC